ncbi:acetyl/propionyl/methylcrotonyl-CoA carboxylase subunit alpha [Actinocorallia aurantiaca]|uniref:biotin carboxylase n=1 Tax=Actinocorallia aurantiaca TaxID=46204 RepID=A0ABN3UCH6_9ACTN
MFTAVLIANRGEIAVRVQRTLRGLGVRSVAVYAPDDAGSVHVRRADEAVPVPSYLDGAAIIEAALATGAQAVHPGYGFLAENAAFARACAEAGLVFVGPPPPAIDAMGDKIEAKLTVAAAGVPVVPGRDERGLNDEVLAEAALEIGLPVLIKPSAGGGGKGMRLVRSADELAGAIASARREARGAFGDDTLLVERFIDGPRHIEVQVFADGHGNVVHLGERECSLQRRHQKIVEEAPSPLLDAERRAEIGAHAVNAARSIGYVGAGTVEFIVAGERPDERYFMEMNTRLQVEHPVTELVTGLDLVELQLRVASGEPLPFTQDDLALDGHAIEARVYAEDPARNFLPTGGRILALTEPAGARVDSGVDAGDEIGSRYDPMIAKVVVHGKDRAEALRAMDRALAGYALLGVHTNVAFLRGLLARPEVVSGELDTGLVERVLPELTAGGSVPDWVLVAAALERMCAVAPSGTDPWDAMDGWRLGEAAWTPHTLVVDGGEPVEVRTRGGEVAVGDGDPRRAVLSADALLLDGRRHPHHRVTGPDGAVWIGAGGRAWSVREQERLLGGGTSAAAGGVLRSPMPGTVLAVKVAEGDQVAEGQPVVIVEAMKMEHTIVAAVAGTVARLPVRAGAQVALDAVLAEITPREDAE